MRNLFAELLYAEAKKDSRVFVVVSDISPVGSMEKFRDEFPDRFINVGVAEQAMIGICSGLAREGAIPFAYTIAAFSTLRPYEFIRDDISIPSLPVNIVGIGAGLVYSTLGPTHHTIEDVAITRMMPNFRVYSPGDAKELEQIWPNLFDLEKPGPTYLRLGKAGETPLTLGYTWNSPRSIKVSNNNTNNAEVLICSYGLLSRVAEEVAKTLSESNVESTVVLTPCLQPFDYDGFLKIASRHKLIVFIEEQLDLGSIGMELTALLHTAGMSSAKVLRVNLEDKYVKSYGSHDQLLHSIGIHPQTIAKNIIDRLEQR